MISEIYDGKAQRLMQCYNSMRDPQTVEEAKSAIASAIRSEEWAREKAGDYLKAMRLMQGKLSMLKHENNKLRKINERLKSREAESITEREREAVVAAVAELGALANQQDCKQIVEGLQVLARRLRP